MKLDDISQQVKKSFGDGVAVSLENLSDNEIIVRNIKASIVDADLMRHVVYPELDFGTYYLTFEYLGGHDTYRFDIEDLGENGIRIGNVEHYGSSGPSVFV